ncbi:hypothetical protein ZWY2020_051209 [Hordeum vulgare]|nr:hypothetical protein ZWY2020_051209 [Hordeum vulgare]
MGMEGLTAASSPLLMGAITLVSAVLYLLGRGGRPPERRAAPRPVDSGIPGHVLQAPTLRLPRRPHPPRAARALRRHHLRPPLQDARLRQDRAIAHRMLVRAAPPADRPATFYDPWPVFFTRSIITATYGPYWRRVRRNLAEALNPARVARFEKARRRTRDSLLARLASATGDGEAVKMRMIFRRTMFDLLVRRPRVRGQHAGAGPPLRPADQDVQRRHELPRLLLPPGNHQKDILEAVGVLRGLGENTPEIFLRCSRRGEPCPRHRHRLALATSNSTTVGEDNDPPCCADTLLAMRLPDEGDRALTDAEITTLTAGYGRQHRHHGHLVRVDHGGAGEPPRRCKPSSTTR